MAEKCSPHGWTLDTLAKHFDERLLNMKELSIEKHARSKERVEAVAEALHAALQSIDKAVIKSEAADAARYASLNELRGALQDNIQTLLPRNEYASNHQALEERVAALRNAVDEKVSAVYDRISATNDRIATNERSISEFKSGTKGKTEGVGSIGVLIVGVAVSLSAISAMASLVLAIIHR